MKSIFSQEYEIIYNITLGYITLLFSMYYFPESIVFEDKLR